MSKYLNVNRIEFAVTYLCNGKCRHCYSSPKLENFAGHIDKDLAAEIVRKVAKKYHPRSVMTFGGEPLLYPEVVYAIHKEATDIGIPVRNVITNGYWSNDFKKIREIAIKLKEAGVNSVDISVDAFHQEYIPLSIVRKAAEECLEVGIEEVSWNPCWVISEKHDNPWNRKTRFILEELKDIPITECGGNVMEPDGLALINLKEYLPVKERIPKGKCGDFPYTNALDAVKVILIEPDGSVAVCDEFYIGNASKTDIVELLESYNPFNIPEMKAIITEGVEGLAKWARSKGIEPDPEGYYSICHMCKSIRKAIDKKTKKL